MVSRSAGQPDAGTAEQFGGCLWADGDDPADQYTRCTFVVSFIPATTRNVTNTCSRIHQKQVLALFGMVLPFALVSQMAWWAVPIVVLVTFTLYGIDGIASQLEDPFGFDKNDIRMDSIVEDIREEIAVIIDEWKRIGSRGGQLFVGTNKRAASMAANGVNGR